MNLVVPVGRTALRELQRVRLLGEYRDGTVRLPLGELGTIVHRYAGAEAYEVEFPSPVGTVLTLRDDEIAESMSRLPGGRFVPARKVTHYLLDTDHPDGAGKARFFERFGFTPDDAPRLIEALARHPEINELVSVTTSPFGIKSVVQCAVATPDGRNPCIRTVWVLDPGSSIQRLVTAYPADD